MVKPAKLLSPILGLGALVCTLLTSSPMQAAQPMALEEAEAALDRCNRLMVGMSLEEAQALTGEALRPFANRLSVDPTCVVFTSQNGMITGVWTEFWLSTEYRVLRDVYREVLRQVPYCFKKPLTVETYEKSPSEYFFVNRPRGTEDPMVVSIDRLRRGESVTMIRGIFNLSAIPYDGDGFSVQ